jgi:hypothetical protein
LTLGSILEQSGELETAAAYLSEAAGHLEDMGDMNCWANASRRLSTAEAALGWPDAARTRLVAVIEAMPILPMHEVAKPRTLDAAAEVLLAAGLVEQAAIALGRAEATELPVSTIFSRSDRHDRTREEITRRLGIDETKRLMDDGAALGVDGSLAKIAGWLRAG